MFGKRESICEGDVCFARDGITASMEISFSLSTVGSYFPLPASVYNLDDFHPFHFKNQQFVLKLIHSTCILGDNSVDQSLLLFQK